MVYQRDYEKKLNVGIVGVGSHAYRNILPTITYLPISLCAICDINVERAEATAAQYQVNGVYTSSRNMYANEDLDAVLLCVSAKLFPELACEARQS